MRSSALTTATVMPCSAGIATCQTGMAEYSRPIGTADNSAMRRPSTRRTPSQTSIGNSAWCITWIPARNATSQAALSRASNASHSQGRASGAAGAASARTARIASHSAINTSSGPCRYALLGTSNHSCSSDCVDGQ